MGKQFPQKPRIKVQRCEKAHIDDSCEWFTINVINTFTDCKKTEISTKEISSLKFLIIFFD